MPAPKKKPNSRQAQSTSTRTKTSRTSLASKKKFQTWMAIPIIAVVAVTGYAIVRYSHASMPVAVSSNCYAVHTKSYPNTKNECYGAQWVSGETGDLITLSDFPSYGNASYTSGDQMCVYILHDQLPRPGNTSAGNQAQPASSQTQPSAKNNGTTGTQQVTPKTLSDTVSVALTLKSNPSTRKVLTVNRYAQGGTYAGSACITMVGADWNYRDAAQTPGGIQLKVLQGPIKSMRVDVVPGPERVAFPDIIFDTEDR